ncbi:hypothetical protein [Streptomyces sp. NPDC051665]
MSHRPAVDGLAVYLTTVGFARSIEGSRMETDSDVFECIEQTV